MNGESSKNNRHHYKINIIRHSSNEININPHEQKQLLSNNRTPKRKKTNLQTKMANAYCTKKHINEHGSSGAKILKEFHKSKSVKCNNGKESDSCLENNSNTEKNNKNDEKGEKEEKEKKEENISPEVNHNINYNININNSNTNEILDLLKFTNNLYNRESHLQKEIPTKKLDINNLSNFDKNFKNDLTKKKLFIQFCLNNPKRKSYKSARNIPLDNKDKTSFSNYLQLKQKQIEKSGEENKIDSSEYEENIYVKYKNTNFKKGNYISKSTKNAKFKLNTSKNKKSKRFKKNIIYEQFEQENENEKSNSRSRQTAKTNKESTKNINKKLSIIKSEVKREKSNIDNVNEEPKNMNKFSFRRCFCCLKSELDDSK